MGKAQGISQGTYSKLENGKIKDCFDYLPKIAQVLGVSFHELVKGNALTHYNYGEVKDHANGNVGHLTHNADKMHYENMILELRSVIADLRTERENWKTKY